MPAGCRTVIVGASAAGLACARCLEELGLGATVLEQSTRVGEAWRNHYDRLHLHTPKGSSALPYLPMPDTFPKYPSRRQVVEYLENYVAALRQQPVFAQRVVSVTREHEHWVTATADSTYLSENVIIATGNTRTPFQPRWSGISNFRGSMVHSAAYKNGRPYQGKKVLIVGFGNSACEIALCLHEHGAFPSMSVRGAVNVIPRDVFGIPVLTLGILESALPPRVADLLNAPIVRLLIGDITRQGLRKLPYGPMTQIRKHRQIPLLDIGTMRLVRQGAVKIRPGVSAFTETGVLFEDGAAEDFDAVILGTGYRPHVNDILGGVDGVLDADGTPLASGQPSPAGLYFCGFKVVPSGVLREIGIEAHRIAESISIQAGLAKRSRAGAP